MQRSARAAPRTEPHAAESPVGPESRGRRRGGPSATSAPAGIYFGRRRRRIYFGKADEACPPLGHAAPQPRAERAGLARAPLGIRLSAPLATARGKPARAGPARSAHGLAAGGQEMLTGPATSGKPPARYRLPPQRHACVSTPQEVAQAARRRRARPAEDVEQVLPRRLAGHRLEAHPCRPRPSPRPRTRARMSARARKPRSFWHGSGPHCMWKCAGAGRVPVRIADYTVAAAGGGGCVPRHARLVVLV